ncbi:MAG: hypothetical protein ACKO96_26695 [Flammeovirgaceae bacterium]
MSKLFNISDWYEIRYFSTGGTRNKKVYVNPDDGEYYFFKESFKKGQRDYKHEFWSEIIASEVGQLLGFDILAYHIAIRGNIVGCISKSMINQASEELIEEENTCKHLMIPLSLKTSSSEISIILI